MIINPQHQQQTEAAQHGAAITRRQFLAGMGALTLAVNFKGQIALAAENAGADVFMPNAFIQIDKNGFVTIISSYIEMGQGTFTGLATLAAEELHITPEQLQVTGSPADLEKYGNPVLAAVGFNVQGTGGSTAMAGAWNVMRTAAASARHMLLQAAALEWKVPFKELVVEDGIVIHKATNKRAGYGAFIDAAAELPVPDAGTLTFKKPAEYQRLGKAEGMRRVDVPEKVNGKAVYTQDIKLPDMLVAVIAHPPRKFAKVASVDKAPALAVPGVVAVLDIPGDNVIQGGVAVLAKNTWIAKKGRDALNIQWDGNTGSHAGTAALFEEYRQLAATPGLEVANTGPQLAEVPEGGHEIDAVFELPYLAHAAMEPMNALIHLQEDSCHMWNGEQWHTADQAAIAKETGLPVEKVQITQLYAGGSFGRRAGPSCDFVIEAARIAKVARAQGLHVPIKMVWLREEDMGGMQYRPMTVHNNKIMINADGSVASWRWRVVGQSFFPMPATQVDHTLMEGAHGLPYAINNMLVEQHLVKGDVPVSWLRSVGHTHSAFVGEVLIDEIAAKTGQDPYQFRRKLLADAPEFLNVLDLVAEKSGWNTPLPQGKEGERRARGIAIRQSFNTIVAQVAEVTVRADNTYKVDKVYCAVDCGQVINPVNVATQVEGGIGFAMSFLKQEITLEDGVVTQSNFHNYPVLRINEAPAVEVFTVDSVKPPTGIGEPGVPPAVPAILNAISSITGKVVRRLPLGAKVLA